MSWEINIPFQDRSQTIREAIEAHVDQALEGEDRDVALQLLLTSGFKTVGELIDHVEALDADGRRDLLDEARTAAGLDTVEDAEAHARFEAANRALRTRPSYDEHGRRSVLCAEANCNAWPQGEQGEPLLVADRIWWCDRHRHLAGPEDHLPEEPKYTIDPHTFAVTAVGAEKERLLAEDEKLRRNAEEREQRRREESERLGKLEEQYRATLKLPVGWGPQ